MSDINDQLLIQTTELTVKLNLLTSMVMGVYSETLPKEVFLNIATKFFDQLCADTEAAYLKLESSDLLADKPFLFQMKMNCLLSISEMKRQWC